MQFYFYYILRSRIVFICICIWGEAVTRTHAIIIYPLPQTLPKRFAKSVPIPESLREQHFTDSVPQYFAKYFVKSPQTCAAQRRAHFGRAR